MDLFEKIFARFLAEVATNGFQDKESLFIDRTHIKASANVHIYQNETIEKEARSYERELQREIEKTVWPMAKNKHKGEHKHVFAYVVNICYDKNNYILVFEDATGNVHGSVSFWKLCKRLKQDWKYGVYYVMDTRYKIPSITCQLMRRYATQRA